MADTCRRIHSRRIGISMQRTSQFPRIVDRFSHPCSHAHSCFCISNVGSMRSALSCPAQWVARRKCLIRRLLLRSQQWRARRRYRISDLQVATICRGLARTSTRKARSRLAGSLLPPFQCDPATAVEDKLNPGSSPGRRWDSDGDSKSQRLN